MISLFTTLFLIIIFALLNIISVCFYTSLENKKSKNFGALSLNLNIIYVFFIESLRLVSFTNNCFIRDYIPYF